MIMLSAKEAKELSSKNATQSELLTGFFEKVKQSAENGERECVYGTDGYHFSDSERKTIEELGYSISWSRPCLWYEVKW